MKRRAYFLSAFILYASTSMAQVLLDQSTGLFTGGIASMDFETASDIYDCAAADDFTVPTGNSWTVDSIKIFGQYSATATTTTPMRIILYVDSAGTPGGVYYQEDFTGDQDLNADGDVMIKFDCPLRLPAARYWLSAVSTKTFGGGGGQWYWTRDTVGGGLVFKWKNQGGGFGTSCSTFTTISTCVAAVTQPGVAFILYGCQGGPNLASFPEDTVVCEADLLSLDPGNGGISNATFNWNTGDTTQSLLITETGFYNVSVTDPNTNCYSTVCIDVTVHPTPQAEDLEHDTICEGQTTTFNGFASCGTCQYLWDGSTNSSTFLTTGVHGWHYLNIINPNTGCDGLDSVWLEVESTDPPELAPDYELGVCEGDTVYLSTVDEFNAYAWSTGETTQGIFVSDSGEYTVTVTSPSGCQGYSDTIYVILQPAPEPIITWSYTGNWKTKLSANEGYQTYEWSTGSTNTSIIASSTGTYSVTVTDEFGCEGSASSFIEVTGIEHMITSQMKIYPNPANDFIHVEWPADWIGSAQLEMTDLTGRVIYSKNCDLEAERIDTKSISPGYYLIQVYSPEGEGSTKILIE